MIGEENGVMGSGEERERCKGGRKWKGGVEVGLSGCREL